MSIKLKIGIDPKDFEAKLYEYLISLGKEFNRDKEVIRLTDIVDYINDHTHGSSDRDIKRCLYEDIEYIRDEYRKEIYEGILEYIEDGEEAIYHDDIDTFLSEEYDIDIGDGDSREGDFRS